MNTSKFIPGTLLKFKSPAKLQLFYEDRNVGWTNQSPGFLYIDEGDMMIIMKTSTKSGHVGQTVYINGSVKVIHYLENSFFDENKGVIAQIDVTANNYYYDVL